MGILLIWVMKFNKMFLQVSFQHKGSVAELALIFSFVLMHSEVLQDVLLFSEHLGASFKLAFKAGGKPVGLFIENTKE